MSEHSAFERTVAEIRGRIRADEATVFSREVREECRQPANVGRIERPDGHARVTGPCGDTMEFFLRMAGRRVAEARFLTDGCGATVVCGSRLTRLVTGATRERATALTPDKLIDLLGGLPPENLHCAKLAIDAFHEALRYNE